MDVSAPNHHESRPKGSRNGTFGKNFPFAGLAPVTRRDLRPQTVEQMFHFRSSLPLRHLVTRPERGGSAVRRRRVR